MMWLQTLLSMVGLVPESFWGEAVILTVQALLVLIPILLAVAYLTLAERKVLGYLQLRPGPSTVGWWGLMQPFADALKLMHKETIVPREAKRGLFFLAPVICFTTSLATWSVIPWGEGLVVSDLNVGLLYLFTLSSVAVYGVILAGWSSGSRYAFLGSMRAVAQMISYEVSIGCVLIVVVMSAGSLNLTHIVEAQKGCWFVWPHLPMAVVFFISVLAEINRTPFDLPEAEAELVSGYNVEYSALSFGLFFLAEYANMILMSALGALLFLGGWLPPLPIVPFTCVPGFVWMALKISLLLFVFLWVRGTVPRYRYDQLMRLGWKIFLPFTFLWIIGTAFVQLCMQRGGL